MIAALLIVSWAIRTIFSLLEGVYYLQLKEYRWDRIRQFLTEQGGFKHFFSAYHLFVLVLLLGSSLLRIFLEDPRSASFFPLLLGTIFLAQSLQYLHHAILRRLVRPRATVKALLILGSTFGIELIILFSVLPGEWLQNPPEYLAFTLGLLMVFEYDLLSFWMIIFNVISKFFQRRIFLKALEKRLKRKDLKVIGITGSYGKSSVKEFLAQILSHRFSVLKTEKNTNTEIGIAKTILERLEDQHEVLVCEMGAYSKGEIRVCCQIARPTIGIFTGLNEQHLALFGSLDDTFQAKWELIQSLPSSGRAIVNADSEELRKRIPPRLSVPLDECSLKFIVHLQAEKNRVHFMYQGVDFTAPLVGTFQALNLLLSIMAAQSLGMNIPEIAKACQNLKAPEKTLELIPCERGEILDDSYNVNPDGLKAALEHLKTFPDHVAIIFFPGILELGERSETVHHELGKLIGNACDYAFFHDPNFREPLIAGALQGGLTRDRIFDDTDTVAMKTRINSVFAQIPDKKFVVLFESRGAEKILEYLKK